MSGVMRLVRPTSPEGWVSYNENLKTNFDMLTCPVCDKEIHESLAAHVLHSEEHPDLESFKEEYDGIPLTTESFRENIESGRPDYLIEFGAFDWRQLDLECHAHIRNKDFFVAVEESGLIAEHAIFDRMVELFNMCSWDGYSVEVGVATCLYISLNENGYDFITFKEIADALNVDKTRMHDIEKEHPEGSNDLRTPEELVRVKLEDIGEVNLDEVREELLSYPEEFKFSGRKPGTIAALATWRAVDGEFMTQHRAGKIFGVTPVSINNAKNGLQEWEGDDEE